MTCVSRASNTVYSNCLSGPANCACLKGPRAYDTNLCNVPGESGHDGIVLSVLLDAGMGVGAGLGLNVGVCYCMHEYVGMDMCEFVCVCVVGYGTHRRLLPAVSPVEVMNV